MKTICMDIDDVCADLVQTWLREYNRLYDDHTTITEIKTWNIVEYCNRASSDAFYKIIDNQEFYDLVPPISGAVESITELRKMGYRIIFATSAMNGHAGAKLRWLKKHKFLPNDNSMDKDYIETADKSIIQADLMVDDNPTHLQSFIKQNKMVIAFIRPWNKSIKWALSANTWADLVEVIRKNGPLLFMPVTNANSTMYNWPADSTNLLSTTAIKYDQGKPEWNLLPFEVMRDVVEIFTYGKNKYKEDNWKLRFKFSKVFNAAMRHISAWQSGENNDLESGKSHLSHVITNFIFLAYYMRYYEIYKDCDDRPTESNLRKFLDAK